MSHRGFLCLTNNLKSMKRLFLLLFKLYGFLRKHRVSFSGGVLLALQYKHTARNDLLGLRIC